jgi:hypothetical protein
VVVASADEDILATLQSPRRAADLEQAATATAIAAVGEDTVATKRKLSFKDKLEQAKASRQK